MQDSNLCKSSLDLEKGLLVCLYSDAAGQAGLEVFKLGIFLNFGRVLQVSTEFLLE